MSPHYLTIAEASELICRQELSPVELTRTFLDRIEALDSQLHAFITLTADLALKEAREAEIEIRNGNYRGPLHGIPLAHKDLYATKGIRTTGHSRVLLDWIPEEDATVISRLREAGAVFLGKLAMSEFAMGGPSPQWPFPAALNPWSLDYVTGGSSSGSAVAVAAGLCMGSLGSDTGGSIRNPASLCGIVGLKPTYGLVSRGGVLPLAWSMDHCGPMTRTVQDTALMLQAIAGYDPKDPGSRRVPIPDYSAVLKKGVKGLVLGIPRRYFFDPEVVESQTLAAVDKAILLLEELGVETRVVDIPHLEQVEEAQVCIRNCEAYAYHEARLKSQSDDYGDNIQRSLHRGALHSAAEYIQSQRLRSLVTQEFQDVMTEVDALVSPTMTRPAWPMKDEDSALAVRYSTRIFSMTGQPAISVCCGFNAGGLPIGLNIAGRAFDEPTVLRIAHTYETNTPWGQKRPAVEV